MLVTNEPKDTNASPGFRNGADHPLRIHRSPFRVRTTFGGETVADSTDAVLLVEGHHQRPLYYFPVDDVRQGFLERSEYTSYDAYKGRACYRTLRVGDRVAENAAWSYDDPPRKLAALAGRISFDYHAMDAWFEEDQEIFVGPRDPQVRVDVLRSSRPVRVVLGGKTVAESRRALFLVETGMPTRYYLPPEDMRSELLPSSLETGCPYKGIASYKSVKVGDHVYENVVWYHKDPLPPAAGVEGHYCFYNEQVDAIYVDGEPAPDVTL